MIVECVNCGCQFIENKVDYTCCREQELDDPWVLRAKEDYMEHGDLTVLEADLDEALHRA